MALKFCQRCRTLMSPQKILNEFFFKCGSCGFSEEINDENSLTAKEKIGNAKFLGKGVMNGENSSADYSNKCKKCGHEKAEIIDMGVFISDEDNLILLKCGKCGFSERVGRKTS